MWPMHLSIHGTRLINLASTLFLPNHPLALNGHGPLSSHRLPRIGTPSRSITQERGPFAHPPLSMPARSSTFQIMQPHNSQYQGFPPASTGHARNTSIAFIISESRGTKTSRPTTPVKRPGSRIKSGSHSRPGTPSKGTAALGSRPSTPNQVTTPGPFKLEKPLTEVRPVSQPPVPRRAAVRNASHTSVALHLNKMKSKGV
jgi:hypothetical protein